LSGLHCLLMLPSLLVQNAPICTRGWSAIVLGSVEVKEWGRRNNGITQHLPGLDHLSSSYTSRTDTQTKHAWTTTTRSSLATHPYATSYSVSHQSFDHTLQICPHSCSTLCVITVLMNNIYRKCLWPNPLDPSPPHIAWPNYGNSCLKSQSDLTMHTYCQVNLSLPCILIVKSICP